MVDPQQTARNAFHPILLALSVIAYSTALHLTYQREISHENFRRGLTYRTPVCFATVWPSCSLLLSHGACLVSAVDLRT